MGRDLFPLDFPDLYVEPDVSVPTQADYLVWKYVSRERVGAHQRCLDLGCGAGLLAIQMARNGAAHVHAIDIDEAAVSNTLSNAFRNGASEPSLGIAASAQRAASLALVRLAEFSRTTASG